MAIGSFHGTSSATTPRGSRTMRSVAVPVALQGVPAVQRAELGVLLDRAHARLDAAARSAGGLPVLAVCSSASSSTWSCRRRAAAFSRAPRSPGAVRAQAGWAARAARTAASAAASSPAGIASSTSPVAGLETSSMTLAMS